MALPSILVVPTDGPQFAAIQSALTAHGYTIGDGTEVVVCDLQSPRGDSEAQAAKQRYPRAMVLGVGTVTAAADVAVDDLVAPAALLAELGPRIGRLLVRQRAGLAASSRDLSVLLELTGRYSEATDIDALLHDVTRRLAEEMAIDRAALVVVDAERGSGTIVAASDDAALKDLRIDLSRYPEIREVVRTGKPVIVEEAPSHPLLEDVKESVARQGIRNIAALPLLVQGRVLGVMLLRRFQARGAFSPREVEFLTAVAHAAAVAFRNVRALESVRGQQEREKQARLEAEQRAMALKRYERYFAHLTDGVAIIDERACVVSLNPSGVALLDVTAHEAVGKHINTLVNPSDEGLLLDLLFSVSQGMVRADVDAVARTTTGRHLTLSVAAAPLVADGGEGVAILTLRDVTRQRQLANELRQTKDFLESLINSSVDAVIAADMQGNIMLYNKAAEAITGFSAAEVVGHMHVTSLYPDSTIPRQVMRRLRAPELGGKGKLNGLRVDILARTGERVPVNMTASILYEGGREVATVGIFTDLRDRLSLERKLSDAETRLLESEKNAVVVALAGTAAHELNQPLTSVMGYAELLKRKLAANDPSSKSIDVIYREAERMAEIVRKIGKITRFETQAYVGSAKILDLDKAASRDE
jgi:PAS domain S-box-containing protein